MIFLIKHSHDHGVDCTPINIPGLKTLLDLEGLEAHVCNMAGIDFEPEIGEDVEFLEFEGRDRVTLSLAEVMEARSAERFDAPLCHGATIPLELSEQIIRALASSGHVELAESLFKASGGDYTEAERQAALRAIDDASGGLVEAIDNDGEVEIDSSPAVSLGTDAENPGAYVQTWTWVPLD